MTRQNDKKQGLSRAALLNQAPRAPAAGGNFLSPVPGGVGLSGAIQVAAL